MFKALRSVTVLLTLAARLFAADLNGKWTGNLKSPTGDLDTALVFKLDGEEQITDGLVKGDEISFVIIAGGDQFKLIYKGKVETDQIRFKVTVGDRGESELIAKRS